MRLTLVLMLIYLSLTAVLATQVDRRFFVNDALAVVVFGVLLSGLLLTAKLSETPRPPAPGAGPGRAPPGHRGGSGGAPLPHPGRGAAARRRIIPRMPARRPRRRTASSGVPQRAP